MTPMFVFIPSTRANVWLACHQFRQFSFPPSHISTLPPLPPPPECRFGTGDEPFVSMTVLEPCHPLKWNCIAVGQKLRNFEFRQEKEETEYQRQTRKKRIDASNNDGGFI